MSQRRIGFGIARTAVITALLLIGTLLTLVGIVYFWADDTILNADHFAATSVEAAKTPQVRAEISRVLVDQAVAVKPDLLTVRPLLETVVETLLSMPAFLRLLALAIIDVHRALLASDAHSYTVDLSNALTVAIGRLRIANPQLADQIPSDVHVGLLELGRGQFAAELARGLAELGTFVYSLGAAGVIMLAAVVALAENRRSALASIGISLATGALLLLVALSVGRQAMVQSIERDSTAAAASSIFDTFTAPLNAWLWILGIAGVLLAAVSAATTRAITAREQALGLRRVASRAWSSTWGRFVTLAVAAGAGIGLLLEPQLSLMLIARTAGLLLLYSVVIELLRLSGWDAAPSQTRLTTAERIRAARASPALRLAAIGAMLVLVTAGAGTLWLNRSALQPENLRAEEGPPGCNGYVELCDRPITEVAFAGTHNSQSAADVKGFFFAEQLHGIPSQLKAGVRAFLIKSHYGIQTRRGVLTDLSRDTEEQRKDLLENFSPDGEAAIERLQASFGQPAKTAKSEAYLCHGFCELGAVHLEDTLADIQRFLDRNPREVIIIFMGDYVSPADTEAAFIRTKLINRVYTHRQGDRWPTLGEMIDVDRRVLVLSEHAGNLPRPEWYHDGWQMVQDTPYTFRAETDFQSDTSCEQNRGRANAPLFLINHWLPSQTPSPTAAERINSYDVLLGRLRRCQELRHLFPNIIAVDFSERGDLFRVVDKINGVGAFGRAGR